MKLFIKKLLITLIILTGCFNIVRNSEVEAASRKVTVSVTADKIKIDVNGVGSSGTAEVLSYEPYDYHSADSIKGLAAGKGKTAVKVADYSCGSSATIEIDRYDSEGHDGLYRKYYVVQNGKILAGPYYASEIESVRTVAAFDNPTKKGLIIEDNDTINTAVEMGVTRAVTNIDLGDFVYSNEDKDGNPVDHSSTPNAIPFVSNGETFYFEGGKLRGLDGTLAPYARAGINVTAIVIAWRDQAAQFGCYPESLRYDIKGSDAITLGFNTSNAGGTKYWIAAMEFLADHYSQENGRVFIDRFAIGNEIDYCYDWYLIQDGRPDSSGYYHKPSLEVFMEEYARRLRMANAAVKKYNSASQVYISLTHNWAESSMESYVVNQKHKRYLSYRPKDMVDWLCSVDAKRGDYNWGLNVHPYPIGTTSSNPAITDVNPAYPTKKNGIAISHNDFFSNAHPVSGDWKTSPWITTVNLELYQLYLKQSANMYKGEELRNVIITEACLCNVAKEDYTQREYEQSTYEQAASIAMMYYRAAHVDCIDEVDYFKGRDLETYRLGLTERTGEKKPAWYVWKYVDTELSFKYTNKYLGYLTVDKLASVTSYKELMTIVKSEFNWNEAWDVNKIQTRDSGETVNETGLYRIYGDNRFETSIKLAQAYLAQSGREKLENVIVASGVNFADALAGSFLAAKKNAPILIVRDDKISMIADFIKENLEEGGRVYILGGTSAVSGQMESALDGLKVRRLAGNNRYETNLKILEAAEVGDSAILVCTGNNFADSLSASASGKAILLVKDSLNDAQISFIKENKENSFYILGGTAAVNTSVENQLKKYVEPKRRAGGNRHETSTLIAREFFSEPEIAVFAYSKNFPDGLCAGPLAYMLKAPLILTAPGSTAQAESYIKKEHTELGVVTGGAGLISDKDLLKIYINTLNDKVRTWKKGKIFD